MENEIILRTEHLKKRFGLDAGFFAKADKFVYAVNDVSFEISRAKTYGLVGESGCGKTTVARLLVKMYAADKGRIIFDDKIEVGSLRGERLKNYRRKVKYIFQDPSKSLNPRKTIFEILTSSLRHSEKWTDKKNAREVAAKIMEEIGLSPSDLDRKPAEFSGGQRQRISIARGLIIEPQILICDEVVSALDVSVQAQILNLLQQVRENRNLSFLFIAHDLKVSCYFCDKIGVMYRGTLVEEAPAVSLYKEALHPYTQLLFAGAGGGFKVAKSGEMKTLLENPRGCPFAHRCPISQKKCQIEIPEWKGNENHKVRCFFV